MVGGRRASSRVFSRHTAIIRSALRALCKRMLQFELVGACSAARRSIFSTYDLHGQAKGRRTSMNEPMLVLLCEESVVEPVDISMCYNSSSLQSGKSKMPNITHLELREHFVRAVDFDPSTTSVSCFRPSSKVNRAHRPSKPENSMGRGSESERGTKQKL